jgi:threonine dehydrogenase-like Zn-dependent dehydrogenase
MQVNLAGEKEESEMLGLWLENQTLSLREDLPIPDRPGEALIRVRLSGICSTDLELVRGYYPFSGIPGHEFVGEVIKAPDINWIGKRVVGEINTACGLCEQCRKGRSTHCENRSVLGILNRDGAHAEMLTLPLAILHRVPDNVPDEAAVFTEPLAAALEIQQQVHIQPADRLLLVGAGRLGQLIAQTLVLTGCDLSVVARHPHQKRLLEERHIRLIAEDDTPERRFDVVVEATGSAPGFEMARKAVRPGGTLVLKSTYKGEITVNFASIVVDEIKIVGSRCGPFAPAIRMMENHQVDPTGMIAGRYHLRQALEAFEQAEKPGVLKVLLTP